MGRHTHSGEVDEISAKAILGILKVKIDLAKIVKKDKDGREVYDMCQAFEDYKEDGRKEGRREGKQEMALKMVKNLMRKQHLSFEEAASILGITKHMQKKLTSQI